MARRKQATCRCTAYHFPHRLHSGACKLGDMPYQLRRQLRARDDMRGPGLVSFAPAEVVVDFATLVAQTQARATGMSVTYLDDNGHKRIALAGPSAPIKSWDTRNADRERAELHACLVSYIREDERARMRRAS